MTSIVSIPDARLCAEPRLNDLPSGAKAANLRIASNFRVKNGDEWEQKALFLDVEIFRGAETIGEYFSTGSPIAVWGELQERFWVDPNTGAQRSSLVIKNAGWAFPPKPAEESQQPRQATPQQGYGQPPAQYQPPAQPQYQQAPPAGVPVGTPGQPVFAGDNDVPW